MQQFLSMLDAPGNPGSSQTQIQQSQISPTEAASAAAAAASSPGLEDAEGILNDICREYYAEGADEAARGLLFRMACGLLRLMLPACPDSSRAELPALLSRLRLVASSRALRQLERECCRALSSSVPALHSAPARASAPLPASVAHGGFGQPAHGAFGQHASDRVSPDRPPSAYILKKYSLWRLYMVNIPGR
jgi:hypothetical protein